MSKGIGIAFPAVFQRLSIKEFGCKAHSQKTETFSPFPCVLLCEIPFALIQFAEFNLLFLGKTSNHAECVRVEVERWLMVL